MMIFTKFLRGATRYALRATSGYERAGTLLPPWRVVKLIYDKSIRIFTIVLNTQHYYITPKTK